MNPSNNTEWFDWSAYFLSSIWASIGAGSLPGNIMVMWLTLSTNTLRTNSVNHFIFHLAIGDLLFSVSVIAEAILIHFPNGPACPAAAYVMFTSTNASLFFPSLVAYNRYVGLCTVTTNQSRLRYNKQFSPKNVSFMIVACWLCCNVPFVPFAFMSRFGPDSQGLCGLTIADSLPITLYSYICVLPLVTIAYAGVIVCYRKIFAWIKRQQSLMSTQPSTQIHNTIKDTNSLLKMMFWVCVLPGVFQMPAILTKVVFNFYTLPLWAGRLSATFMPAVSLLNPWITMLVVRPYRKALCSSKLVKVVPSRLLHGTQISDSSVSNVNLSTMNPRASNIYGRKSDQ